MKKMNKIEKLKTNWPKILLKLSITALILAIFLILFFTFNGISIFKKTNYVSTFNGNDFQIHTIDVAQGDCFLTRLPNDKTMLIDCGDGNEQDKVKSYINQYLASENLSKIDYFVLTHPDYDHIGGGESIIDSFNIENLYRPKYYCEYEEENMLNTESYKISSSYSYNQIIKKAYSKSINMVFSEKGIVISEEGYKIEFLSPENDNYTNSNDYSAVIMITCHGKKALFMGDAGVEIESTLISEYGDELKADILKLGHHGSKTSSSEEFLQVVNPTYAILSVDEENSYGLPNVDVLKNLNNIDAKIISTTEKGNFAISVKNDEIKVAFEQKANIDVALIFAATLLLVLAIWALPLNFKCLNKDNSNKK